MLEFLVLRALCGKIGALVARKGYAKVGYQILVVVLWLAGEIGGFIVASNTLQDEDGEANFLISLVCALLGAALGAALAFAIANSLSDNAPKVNRFSDDYSSKFGASFNDDRAQAPRIGDGTERHRPGGDEGYTDRPEDRPRRGDERITE